MWVIKLEGAGDPEKECRGYAGATGSVPQAGATDRVSHGSRAPFMEEKKQQEQLNRNDL